MLASTFRRGIWEADLLPPEADINLRSYREITSNEIWTTDKLLTRSIRVRAGAELELQNMTLRMPKDGLIIVEPGARLTANGATLTNSCGNTWEGIQVWGNSALAQNSTNQGIIVLNNSTIEYARTAISPWEVGNYPNAAGTTGGTGGIIQATNSSFINNMRTSDFMKYESPSGQREASYFLGCLCTVNDDFRSFNGINNSFMGPDALVPPLIGTQSVLPAPALL